MMDAAVPAPPAVQAVEAPPNQPAVLEFVDSTGISVGGSTMADELNYVTTVDESLEAFLSRPVLVATSSWASTAFTAANYDPWTAIMSNAVIKRKTSNFAMIRATLHVKATFNGTPLQAGALQLAYAPGEVNLTQQSFVNVPANFSVRRGSQLRNIEIYGSGSSSGEIVAPFFFRKPFASIIAGNSDIAKLGRIRIQQLIPLTSSSNAVVVAGTVQIFAWLTDVQIRVSTFLNTMHRPAHSAKEAKPDFNISRPATVVAKAASMLSGLPIVGPMATAASVVATGVASVASAFGYSRPFDLTDKMPMIPRYVGGFALTEGVDSPEKLSTDPKQGVSMGSAWLGLPGEPDPMAIASIASREALTAILTSTWTTSTAVGTQLYAAQVYPHAFNFAIATDTYEVTPMSYAAAPFRYWTGTINLRIKAIAGGMSRGRLLIWHYPHNDTGYQTATISDIINTCQCCMLDLEGSTDVEFSVKPSMTMPWMTLLNPGSGSSEPANKDPVANGFIVVSVANALSAPLASSVGLLIYVRGGPDFQVAVPALSRIQNWQWNNQMDRGSGAVDSSVPTSGPGGSNSANTTCDLTGRATGEIPVEPYFGERIESFRSLAKRFCLYYVYYPIPATVSPALTNMAYIAMANDFYGMPNITDPTTIPWTWATYAMLPFLAVRGGMRYRAVMAQLPGTSTTTMTGARLGWERGILDATSTTGITYIQPGVNPKAAMRAALLYCGDGMSYTPPERQPVAEAEFPYYSKNLFTVLGSSSANCSSRHPDVTVLWASFGYPPASTAPVAAFDIYHAAADDFSCMEWCGVGSVYMGTAFPLPAFSLASY